MSYTRIVSIVFSSFLLLLIIRCDHNDSDDPTDEQLQISKLAKQWEPSGGQFAMLNNEDVSSAFENFTLSFDNQKGFAASHGNSPVWPGSGTYEFDLVNGSYDLNRLIRSDGVVINIVELTDDNLKITFYYDSSSAGGRVSGLSGEYSFDLVAR